jgi:hypothetical protein
MMDFIYKLFPYNSLFNLDGNTLTAWWVVVIIIIFIFFTLKLYYRANKLRAGLAYLSRKFSEDLIKKDSLFMQIWKDYQATFIEINGKKKTDVFSYLFFNENNLLAANTNLKLINSIPSTLVGFGILGTFVGLTYGISNFQTDTTEEIKVSIEILLSGMGTAFVSSIYGMLLSLVFTIFERVQLNSLHSTIHAFCYTLDKSYKITKEDERFLEANKQQRLISKYFVFTDEQGNDVLPGNVFRDIFNESRKQSIALQSFSTDLANLIEAGFEKIINDPEKGVLYELQALKTEIVNLGSKLQDPASEMTNNIVKELETSLAKMIEEFKLSVSGSAKTEIENLTSLLNQAGNSLINFPNNLELMTLNLNENFKGLQEVVQSISKQTLQQSEHSTSEMRRQVEEMSGVLKDQVGELQVGQEVLLNKQNENLQVSDNLLLSFNSSIERMNDLTNQVNLTISSFSSIQGELNSASGHLKHISDNVLHSTNSFKEAQILFNRHSNDFLSSNADTIKEIQNSLKQARDLYTEYTSNFEIIEKGLQGIFQQIDTGLVNYRDTVGTSVEKFLSTYSEALTDTAKSLQGAASKQEDILEELNELLSKLLNGNNR